ncbi:MULTISPECIES: thioesterase family protein [unclassified Crossiella]|uniref:acyl-CoA thioesterase n=1 Tax=unclassified Crossiella TaxID=2620835 RepID=UPI001FFF72EB|nr:MULTISPECIES: thioesterase family protein [unclassified Crossiella]MCK2241215.1 acyl-CoA thioesterase [Crossiella sp. S99.2]MCK2253641.1 acyl-CoA thioesterase [Crossiella sp. S99.1]
MPVYITQVRPRWADMDVFHHVNHAAVVTLLEEARAGLLFVQAARLGFAELSNGLVLSRLEVDYKGQLRYTGGEVYAEVSIENLRHASFVVRHTLHTGATVRDPVAVTARTTLVPFDVSAQRPRRLSGAEREFLAGYQVGESVG